MPFLSYAQNMEDVMLHRALREVKQGFYVDVGANSPDLQSVTKAFYQAGWRGINIERIRVCASLADAQTGLNGRVGAGTRV